MDVATTRARRDAVIDRHGPWVAYNVHLGHGVYSMVDDRVGMAELLIGAVVQVVADLCTKPLEELRVLDLACHEGGFGIELGLHGAAVVGVEGRQANVEKARFAAEALGLDRVTFIQGDVRDAALWEELGDFDVVLCLGILYHLEARDAVRLIKDCYAHCKELAIVRTAIGLSANTSTTVDGFPYHGRRYQENTEERGASLDNPISILPTRTSLLNLLSDVGFSSVLEVCNPAVPGLEAAVDSVTLAAIRGQRANYLSLEGLDEFLPMWHPERPRLSWLWKFAHPQQGPYWRAREALLHTFMQTLFGPRRSIEEWQPRRRP